MKIICATDLLPKSEPAIERAGLLSAQLAANLTLLHVVSSEESQQVLETNLKHAFARTKSRAEPLLWRTRRTAIAAVRVGNPARSILDAAGQSNADLLILGPHRKRPLRTALTGTVVEQAIASGVCPVLVVRDEVRLPYRRVLLALDLSQASISTLRAAESLVLTPEVAATVVHGEADEAMRELLERQSADFARYDLHADQRPAAAAILQAANHRSPDLIVVGAHGGGRLRRALVGSVASRVLHDASCDVLVVPEGSLRAAHRIASEYRDAG